MVRLGGVIGFHVRFMFSRGVRACLVQKYGLSCKEVLIFVNKSFALPYRLGEDCHLFSKCIPLSLAL